MKAALYTRVSTEDQTANGVSLSMQEERLRAYCKARDWQVHKVYIDDGASAKTLDRPALTRLMSDAQARKFEAVCAYKLDRLTRSVRDLGTLLEFFDKRDLALVSLSESFDATTAAGRLMVNLLGSVSQWEREIIGERTSAALKYKRNHLTVYGEVPIGFKRIADRLEPLEPELATVRRIYGLRRDGLVLRRIADTLNRDRIRTKKGKRWAAEQVRYVLGNELYGPYVGEMAGAQKETRQSR
jgi:site-specific DNA recombinase